MAFEERWQRTMANTNGHWNTWRWPPLLEQVNDTPTIANVELSHRGRQLRLGKLAEARKLATRVAEAQPDDAGLNIAYALHLLGLIAMVEGNREKPPRAFGKRSISLSSTAWSLRRLS